MSFGLLQNPSSDDSIIVTLEYTISKCVKLLDHLTDLHEPLINWISSGSSPAASSGLVDNCFICVCVHSFPICVPSFLKRERHLKLNTGFCGSYGGSETSIKLYEKNHLHPICNLHAKQQVASCKTMYSDTNETRDVQFSRCL